MVLAVGDARVSASPFVGQTFWSDRGARDDLGNFVKTIPGNAVEARLRHAIWRKLPNTAMRLESSSEPPSRWRASVYARYMASRLGLQSKLSGGQSVANWIVSDVFEDWFKRQVFCLTDEIRALLNEPVLNRRVMKHEINLTLFAFWRRHYPHIDIFSEEGLRLVQYRFATAPFISDKNNVHLVSDGVRQSLSGPADMYRKHELPWSWYWMFLLDDQGLGGRMGEEEFVRTTSFKEVALDTTQPDRLSFNPHIWRAYWGAGASSGFTRFDLALISLIADVAVPEVVVAERGADYWHERLRREVYEGSPELAVLSAGTHPTAARALELPMRDLVIIGYANETGVGRNLWMFKEATAAFNPLIFNADDGACVNPDASYNPAVGVRARVVILCVNADRAPEMLSRFAGICEDAHVIGFYLWESDRPPANHVLGARAVDEIWCPTTYVADAYRKITTVPVHVINKGLQKPLDYVPFLDRFRQDPSEFIFLTAAEFGSSIVRKNPLDVVKAFQKAFEHSDLPVRLIIKIREVNPGHWSNIDSYWEEIEERIAGDDRISVLEGSLTSEEYWTLLWTVDAMVSLHRSEGFGYVIADSMLAKKSVIVSDYSGSQDFCDESDAFLVPVTQTPAPPECLDSRGYIGQWGIPDVDKAALAMYEAAEHPDLRAARAHAGFERISQVYDFKRWTDTIGERIRAYLPEPAAPATDTTQDESGRLQTFA
ncbi:glycosyltransferase [Ancylobacter sp. 6x-1]|uniref:Glycosyltransferase n=1 Tax=Ancylobacter crimeensis TaxID=2579147 RepID=A0ABT0DAU6_9HYPH|nr:glycosyltransferase [Ancylobacter crimeensis]MCK0196999.1 glycosyltransferase [Ancylobacter crimeensis]